MFNDLAMFVLGAAAVTPIAFAVGAKHERSAAAKQRLYLRRVTNARSTVARPGTTVASVRTASLSRRAPNVGNTAPPRK